MAQFTVYANPASGYMERALIATYADAHDGVGNGVATSMDIINPLVGQTRQATGLKLFSIFRAGLLFRTSLLPSMTIDSASAFIQQYGAGGVPTNDITIYLVSGDDLQDPLTLADYQELLDETASEGSIFIPAGGIADGNYHEIVVDEGLISLLSDKWYGLRTTDDINSVPPAVGDDNYILITASYSSSPPLENIKKLMQNKSSTRLSLTEAKFGVTITDAGLTFSSLIPKLVLQSSDLAPEYDGHCNLDVRFGYGLVTPDEKFTSWQTLVEIDAPLTATVNDLTDPGQYKWKVEVRFDSDNAHIYPGPTQLLAAWTPPSGGRASGVLIP